MAKKKATKAAIAQTKAAIAQTKAAIADRKPMPFEIYGHWENPGTEDEYLATDVRWNTVVETDRDVRVGVYRLAGYATVRGVTKRTYE